ncbi:hypothetical protein EXIGLDRAFT_827986, partial [Exidia glandulosa HHB12029]
MIFGPKTTHYLRVTRGTVLPLYLYLDERHIEWMSERTLQYVLSDLRPLIAEKLELERAHLLNSSGPKQFQSKVETNRGDTYQFGWWFTQAEPHAVVLKTRRFERAPTPPQQSETEPVASTSKRKRASSSRSGRRAKKPAPSTIEDASPPAETRDTEPIDVDEHMEDDTPRSPSPPVKVEDDDEYVPDSPPPPEPRASRTVTVNFAIDEEEEEKKKPILKLAFQSFSPSIALCVVVEPWPPLPPRRRQTSVFSLGGVRAMTRAPSDAPPTLIPQATREQTPLFLPDFDRDSATPAPAPAPFFRQPSLPFIPSFQEATPTPGEEEDPPQDLMEFTRALQATETARGGSPDEQFADDDAVLYGDADEMRTGR